MSVVFASVWILWRLLPALAWASVLAIATWPLRQGLARRGLGKNAIAVVLVLALAVVLVLPLIELGIEAAREGDTLAQWIRDISHNGLATPEWLSHVPYLGNAMATWWHSNLADPQTASTWFGRADRGGIFTLTRLLGIEVASRLNIFLFTLLALFFLYRDGPVIMSEAQVIGDRLFGPPGKDLGENAIAAVRGTVNGAVIIGLVEGVLLGFAYAVTGLPHATLLGLATGVLGTVPYGAPLVIVVCILVLIVQSQTVAAIGLLVFGSMVVFVADHFVRPILIGNSTRLPFLWIMLGIFGGLETFGLIGLFLGPAVMSLLVAVWQEAASK